MPCVTYFDAQLQILDLLEHKAIFTAGYKVNERERREEGERERVKQREREQRDEEERKTHLFFPLPSKKNFE